MCGGFSYWACGDRNTVSSGEKNACCQKTPQTSTHSSLVHFNLFVGEIRHLLEWINWDQHGADVSLRSVVKEQSWNKDQGPVSDNWLRENPETWVEVQLWLNTHYLCSVLILSVWNTLYLHVYVCTRHQGSNVFCMFKFSSHFSSVGFPLNLLSGTGPGHFQNTRSTRTSSQMTWDTVI